MPDERESAAEAIAFMLLGLAILGAVVLVVSHWDGCMLACIDVP